MFAFQNSFFELRVNSFGVLQIPLGLSEFQNWYQSMEKLSFYKWWAIHGCFCNMGQFWLRKHDGLKLVPDFRDQGFEKCLLFKMPS